MGGRERGGRGRELVSRRIRNERGRDKEREDTRTVRREREKMRL